MNLFTRKNKIILFTSITLIAIGFILMKLEPAEHGYGPWALTLAPLLVISGFALGIVSFFYGSKPRINWKDQKEFLIAGWGSFLVSFVIYLSTLEDTASLWDCAEFIACAYKLQVPHAPGAPLFLMIGRLFSLLAFGDPFHVAFWVNMTSALSSATTVMFTFWIIVMLGLKINSSSSTFSLILAGLAGGFTIAFSDSFWYSAVEAETYAMATLFMVICFWAILKWGQEKEEFHRLKWFIFIFYVLGLSVGIHPISLLVLPAISIIIMLKYRKFSWKILVVAVSLGAVGILLLNHIILFGTPGAMKYFDIFFVNTFGMPFYSGALIFIILLIITGYLIYRWSVKRAKKIISILITGLMYFLIGYSSYYMIIIRSQGNPAIDENNPENMISLVSYLKRDSYGSRQILYGPYFNAQVKSYTKGDALYRMGKKKYEVSDHTLDYEYDERDMTILPRMYSNQENHIRVYREWTGLREGEKPGFIENIKFMFSYQFGHMYFRYLMFNFAGRTSDIQHADWLNPIYIFENIPDELKENKARNNFLMLPFLLGIIGLFYHYRQDRSGFWSVMALFLFYGLILVFYLNSTPNEPRERDYIYVGSYLAFSIWCGISALAIYHFLVLKIGKNSLSIILGGLTILIPLLLLVVGYDDHDRSHRTIQVDHARNTLASCAPNSILFTGGDNDTFPLWYVQEVEDFRTDVRVIVLSYFNAEWYIDQMKQQVNDSSPLPLSLQNKHYKQGGLNDVLPFVERSGIKGAIDLGRYLDLIRTEHKGIQVTMAAGTKYNSVPSRNFYMNIDPNIVPLFVDLPSKYHPYVSHRLAISWNGNYMEKNELLLLDLINTNSWKRPIYFNITSLNSLSLDLKEHVLQEGLVYRLFPVQLEEEGAINTWKMYENLMEKSVYHDLDNENVYYNHEDYQLRILQNLKVNYNTLANSLLDQHETNKAEEIATFILEKLYGKNKCLDISTVDTIDIMFKLGWHENAILLAEELYKNADKFLEYYYGRPEFKSTNGQIHLYVLRQLYNLGIRYDQPELVDKCAEKINFYYSSR